MTFPGVLWGGAGMYETAGVLSTPELTAITAAGSTHTKGSYTQLIASTSYDAYGIYVYAKTELDNRYLFDIAVGAASSEQVILENVPIHSIDWQRYYIRHAYFPISIPAGTRLSARCQSDSASAACQVGLMLHSARGLYASYPLSRCVTYGALTASTYATSVDAGAVADTYGSWVEFSSSCTHPVRSLLVASFDDNSLPGGNTHGMDVGIGAAASEEVIIECLRTKCINNTSRELKVPYWFGPFPVDIPEGTRIAVRNKSSTTDATARLSRYILFCMD